MIKNNLGLGCCVQFVVFGSLRVVLPSFFGYLLTSMRSRQIEFFTASRFFRSRMHHGDCEFITCEVMETSFGPSALASCSATPKKQRFFLSWFHVNDITIMTTMRASEMVLSWIPMTMKSWSWHHRYHDIIIIIMTIKGASEMVLSSREHDIPNVHAVSVITEEATLFVALSVITETASVTRLESMDPHPPRWSWCLAHHIMINIRLSS